MVRNTTSWSTTDVNWREISRAEREGCIKRAELCRKCRNPLAQGRLPKLPERAVVLDMGCPLAAYRNILDKNYWVDRVDLLVPTRDPTRLGDSYVHDPYNIRNVHISWTIEPKAPSPPSVWLRAGYYDLVIPWYQLPYLPHPEIYTSQALTLLRPGGILLVEGEGHDIKLPCRTVSFFMRRKDEPTGT